MICMKQINFFLFFVLITVNYSFADINKDFENWKQNFKIIAIENRVNIQYVCDDSRPNF